MVRRLLLTATLLVILAPGLMADHFMGGEIMWECLPNGHYRFIMKVYRECSGIDFSNYEDLNTNVPGLSVIHLELRPFPNGKKDLSPSCKSNPSFPHISCHPDPTLPNTGAIEEWTYTSDSLYPFGVYLPPGPIPASGWVFYFTNCCRNASTNYTGTVSKSWWLRAVMYPYPGQDPTTCWDNSPVFGENPTTVITTGYPFSYNPNGYDPELDSLSYEWTPPMQNLNYPLSGINPGYSYTSPLPGPAQNPLNVAAVVNAFTGEVSFNSHTTGAFITSYKVTAFKCGIKVAEIFRDMEFLLFASPSPFNSPPNVTPPFVDPITGLQTSYFDTVWAGTAVNFNISAIDYDLLNDSVTPQTLKILASGLQFGGDNFSDPLGGCLNPPCATLSPPPPAANPITTATSFNWQTTCSHLNTESPCGGFSNTYNFVLKVIDDFCPVPAYAWKTVTLVVRNPIMPPPEFSCIAVAENGQVSLNWQLPDTNKVPNTWAAYYIYRSNSASGPFTLLDSIVLDVPGNVLFQNTKSYTDVTANGQAEALYYYMRARSGCYGDYFSANSDTISTIFLNTSELNETHSSFSWNAIHNPAFATSYPQYDLYRKFPGNQWTKAGSGIDHCIDSLFLCDDSIAYRVELHDSSGCVSVSNIVKTRYYDHTPPPVIAMQNVSVVAGTENVDVSWAAGGPEILGYLIYFGDGANSTILDTVYGQSTTHYLDSISPGNVCDVVKYYAVAGIDSCWNIGPINFVGIYNTILPQITEVIHCPTRLHLDWNPYTNLSDVQAYRVYHSENSGPRSLIATVLSPIPGQEPPTSFVHTDCHPDSWHCYTIEAINSTGTVISTSCEVCQFVGGPRLPEFNILKVVSVADNRVNRLQMLVDTAASIFEYKIMRSLVKSGPYDVIAVLPKQEQPLVIYDDFNAQPDQHSYYYHVLAFDTCGLMDMSSDTSRTILLTSSSSEGLTNHLSWNDYEGWTWSSVKKYELLREIKGITGPVLIASLPVHQTHFDDDVSTCLSTNGNFSYTVRAIENPGGLYPFADTSYSNTVQAVQQSLLYVPNAFTPQGLNPVFKPVIGYADFTDYSFHIFNRWGGAIFESLKPDEGWDGTYQGGFVPAGTYVFTVSFMTSAGQMYLRKGTVSVIY